MPDWPLIVVRWSLYADLGLLFGLPLFRLYALRGGERELLVPLQRPLAALALIGLALSVAGLWLSAATMMGVDPKDVDRSTLLMLLTETSLGWAFCARALGLAAIVLISPAWRTERRPLLPAVIALAAVIVGSLAWSGHGAAVDGIAGTVQLTGDIVHLLAASAWIGAIAGFILVMLRSRRTGEATLAVAHRALVTFATAGGAIVALVVLTGLINGFFLVGPSNALTLMQSRYGELLLVKLVLFAAMLLIAARNRWHLTPALGVGLRQGETDEAQARLRRSLWAELFAATLILALVAWLGTLAPPSTIN